MDSQLCHQIELLFLQKYRYCEGKRYRKRHVLVTLHSSPIISYLLTVFSSSNMTTRHVYLFLSFVILIDLITGFRHVTSSCRQRSFHNIPTLSMSLQKEVEKQSFKEKLYLLSAKTNRGSMVSDSETSTAASLIENLEMLNPTYRPAMSQSVVGDWELIFASTRIIRASPIFQVIRAAFGENIKLFNGVFNILKEPLKVTRIGRVTQTVSTIAVSSGLETEFALIPFLKIKNIITTTGHSPPHLFITSMNIYLA